MLLVIILWASGCPTYIPVRKLLKLVVTSSVVVEATASRITAIVVTSVVVAASSTMRLTVSH